MKSKLMIPLTAFIIIVVMAGYFLINPSYEKSLKAKYYYETGEYREALVLAKEAFSIDVYNRMASTIMAQSITSLKYVSFNDEAKKYLSTINDIATQETITEADKAKIRTMSSIVTASYIKLAPSVITDNDLVEEAARYNDSFEKLLEKVNK